MAGCWPDQADGFGGFGKLSYGAGEQLARLSVERSGSPDLTYWKKTLWILD